MTIISFEDRFLGEPLRSAASKRLADAHQNLQDLQSKVCTGAEWTGWYDWPSTKGFALNQEITAYVQSLDIFYDVVLVIGIGGSYLGCRAIADALTHSYQHQFSTADANSARSTYRNIIYAGHTISEEALIEVLDLLGEREPMVNVISKSGTTTEPGVAFRTVRNFLEQRYGKDEASQRIIATTDGDHGALRSLAQEKDYKTFVVPSDVGGRYSVLTAVGLVPLALAGYNTRQLLEGADALFKELGGDETSDHPVLRYAATRQEAFLAGKRIELLAYNQPKLTQLVEWWKQLFGESEGKGQVGLFPAGLAYTTDLHSLGQYVQEGPRNMIETFLHFKGVGSSHNGLERRLRVPKASTNLDGLGYLESKLIEDINDTAMNATKIAHHDGGIPCMALHLEEISENSIGSLIAFFETSCAVSAALLDLNPFDQPGVEAYKRNLFGLLGKPGFESVGEALKKRL